MRTTLPLSRPFPGLLSALNLRTVALALALLAPAAARTEIRLAKIFTEHMVVQQELPIAVFGYADPGEAVTVAFHGAQADGQADANGRWEVKLPAMKADGEGHTVRARMEMKVLRVVGVIVRACLSSC